MARVKICPVCGHRNEAAELECENDFVSLADIPALEKSGGEKLGEDLPASTSPTNDHFTKHENTSDSVEAILQFPWGGVKVGRQLNVGRDSDFSPVAENVINNDFVSRRHAQLSMTDGQVYLHSFNPTNPTYHNDEPLESGQTVLVNHGDKISFSRYLETTIHIARTRSSS